MNNKKILICDDEDGVRESLRLILSDHYDLILTQDGFQCLDCLANAKDIGLVLLDIKIQEKNGLDILKEIKEKYPKINVIMIGGYQAVLTEAVRLGAIGTIVKPFKSDEVWETVRLHLG